MPYKVKSIPWESDTNNRIEPKSEPEILVGVVQGKRATDIEERFAKSLYKRKLDFIFQVSFFAGQNMPGELRLDFMIDDIFKQPVQIDGEFAHKSAAQKAKDTFNDARLDSHLSGQNALPTIRIDGENLQTQEDSDFELSKII